MDGLTLRCPAKVNLYLKVVGRRPDGYHELITVMQPLTLADSLSITLTPGGITCDCQGADLPRGEGNLAIRAVKAFQQATSADFGVHLRLVKHIPVAAGLGGGSSNAAGVLRGLNQLRGMPLDRERLAAVARQLGADVPFFLLGGPALGRGIGEILTPMRLPSLWYVLVNPGFPVSTAEVYGGLRPPFQALTLDQIHTMFQRHPTTWLHNDLEAVTMIQHPELAELKKALQRQGAQGVLMSGSGPTIFGIFPTAARAQAAASRLQAETGFWTAAAQGVA